MPAFAAPSTCGFGQSHGLFGNCPLAFRHTVYPFLPRSRVRLLLRAEYGYRQNKTLMGKGFRLGLPLLGWPHRLPSALTKPAPMRVRMIAGVCCIGLPGRHGAYSTQTPRWLSSKHVEVAGSGSLLDHGGTGQR